MLADRKEYAEIAKGIREPLKRTLQWYAAMLPPDGIVPGINDGDRQVFPLALLKCRFAVSVPPPRRSGRRPPSKVSRSSSGTSIWVVHESRQCSPRKKLWNQPAP